MRTTSIINNVLLDKKQKLLVKYHPIPILDCHFRHSDGDINLESLNDEEVDHILEESDQNKMIKIDQTRDTTCKTPAKHKLTTNMYFYVSFRRYHPIL